MGGVKNPQGRTVEAVTTLSQVVTVYRDIPLQGNKRVQGTAILKIHATREHKYNDPNLRWSLVRH